MLALAPISTASTRYRAGWKMLQSTLTWSANSPVVGIASRIWQKSWAATFCGSCAEWKKSHTKCRLIVRRNDGAHRWKLLNTTASCDLDNSWQVSEEV